MRPSRRALVGLLLGMSFASLAVPLTARADSPQVGGYASVQGTDGSGVRMRAGVWSRVIRNLPEGTMARVVDEAADDDGGVWYQVETPAGEGWVYGSYLQEASEDQYESRAASNRGGYRNTAADIGMQYVGYRYVWGSTNPAIGFDSSGFLYYVYRAMGVPIPRDYWGMMNQGTPITQSQLQPGDLVFFVNTYKSGLSHGAIYIGNGQIVHAIDERSGVQVSNMYSSYYAPRYYASRRMY